MINLLPQEQKKRLEDIEKFHLYFNVGALFLLFFLSLTLIMIFVQVFISGEEKIQGTMIKGEEGLVLKEKEIGKINDAMDKFLLFNKKRFLITPTLEELSKVLPPNLYLTNFSISCPSSLPPKKGKGIPVAVSGFSPTRELLLKFKGNLENDTFFSHVVFSPEDWVKSENINFTLRFVVKR